MSLKAGVMAIGLLALTRGTMLAQVGSSRASISGTVFDSVAMRPLSGAIVQIVSSESPAGVVGTVVTDSGGAFAFDSIAPGSYYVGFMHAVADSLGIESPLRQVQLTAAEHRRVALALPAPRTIVTAVCGGDPAADSTGLLLGRLLDARTSDPLEGGTVSVTWNEIIIDNTGLRTAVRRLSAQATSRGWFGICRVPGAAEVLLAAVRGGDSTGALVVSVPVAGLARRDIRVGGVATIRGTILDERGRPVHNARIAVAGRERLASSDTIGRFRLTSVPSGTMTIEARAIGHAPEHRTLTLDPDADTTLHITLTTMRRVLDTIRVSAQTLFDRDTRGFQRRRRMGFGTFYDADYISRRHAVQLTQILQMTPSVEVYSVGFDRRVLMRAAAGYCRPAIFIDNIRMPEDWDIDILARPEELVGIEVYRPGLAPVEFSAPASSCGSIVLWTKTRVRSSK
jgi:hypothetical protein